MSQKYNQKQIDDFNQMGQGEQGGPIGNTVPEVTTNLRFVIFFSMNQVALY